MVSILFVCMGNICRSPAAEGILKKLADEKGIGSLHIESCGMGDWYVGKLPDERMREAAKARGVVLSSRAKQFDRAFFESFDYILASDKEVLNSLLHHAQSSGHKAKVHLMTAFSSSFTGQDVPDPYYYGNGAFEGVLDILEDACEGLLEQIKQ